MTVDTNELASRSLNSIKWSSLGEIFSRSLQPLLVLVIGALISPAEFGLLGIATIVLGVGQLLQDMGLAKTLVQRGSDVATCASQVFWINLAVSALLYGLVFMGAPVIGAFFGAPESAALVRLLGIRLLLLAGGAVQLAILQRELKFRAVFFGRFAGALAACMVTVPMALMGRGVWSLAWGMLAATAVNTLVLWIQSDWRPAWDWDRKVLVSVLGFSKWVFMEGLLAAAIQWGDSTIVGHYLGTETLGKYRMAANAVAFLTGMIFSPLTPVALSWLSRLQHRPLEFSVVLIRLTRAVTILAFPMGIGLALLAGTVVRSVLGPQWAGTELVLAALGLKLAIDWTVGFNAVAYTAVGRPDLNVKLLACVCMFTLPAFVIGAGHGLLVFVVIRLFAAAADNLLSWLVAMQTLQLRSRAWVKVTWPAVPAALTMAVSLWLFGRLVVLESGFLEIALQVMSGVLVYAAALFYLDRTALQDTARLFFREHPTS